MIAILQLAAIPDMPDWAIPAIGGGCAVVILTLGYLIFGKKSEPPPKIWQHRPHLRNHERPMARSTDMPNASDQRTNLRRTGHPVDVHITDVTTTMFPRSGIVIDRSLRGLCIAVETAYDKGTVINVRPVTADTSMPWVQVQVKNCRNVGKAFELGCEFLQVPPTSILMMFG